MWWLLLRRGGLCRACVFEKSPRYVAPDVARDLALAAPVGLAKVALVVNGDDGFLDHLVETVPLDMLQLHATKAPHAWRRSGRAMACQS